MKELLDVFELARVLSIAKALILLCVGYVAGRAASAAAAKLLQKKFTAHSVSILRRVIFYFIFGLLCVSALRELGFDLSVLLGAAGLLTVAVGFASQTSASNLISGVFLMVERPFSIGDIIKVNNITGEVISIDLLSIKLRTFDNLFVRIPNETMIKTEVTTLTRFPIRRIDLMLGVAYKEDIDRVRALLVALAEKNPLCLDEPPPLFIVIGFGASSVDLQLSVWARRENFLSLKNGMFEEIKKAFDENGIEIPFPHMSFYTGSDSKPLPIQLVQGEQDESA